MAVGMTFSMVSSLTVVLDTPPASVTVRDRVKSPELSPGMVKVPLSSPIVICRGVCPECDGFLSTHMKCIPSRPQTGSSDALASKLMSAVLSKECSRPTMEITGAMLFTLITVHSCAYVTPDGS